MEIRLRECTYIQQLASRSTDVRKLLYIRAGIRLTRREMNQQITKEQAAMSKQRRQLTHRRKTQSHMDNDVQHIRCVHIQPPLANTYRVFPISAPTMYPSNLS